jgi:hypothetical protein
MKIVKLGVSALLGVAMLSSSGISHDDLKEKGLQKQKAQLRKAVQDQKRDVKDPGDSVVLKDTQKELGRVIN